MIDIKDIEYIADKAGTKFSINALNTNIPMFLMSICNQIIKNATTILIISFIITKAIFSIKKQTIYRHLFDLETFKVYFNVFLKDKSFDI